MKVINITPDGKTTEITQLCSSIQWSGDMQQAARKLDLQIVDPAYDGNLPDVDIKLGNLIKLLTDKGQEIFQGYIFMREKDFGSQATKILCYDGMAYLTKSTATYNFVNMTAEQIARKVCGDFGISPGNLAKTGIKQSHIVLPPKTLYEIIADAYVKAGEQSKPDKKSYVLLMQQGKLNIVEKGGIKASYTLDPGVNISSSRYSESMENMINRVKIYDDKGNYVDKVEKESWIKSYGILQGAYSKERGKDAVTAANNMLKDIEKKGEIEAVADDENAINCIAGNAVEIKACYSGIQGLFYINSDSHTWQGGVHKMQLTLDYQKTTGGKG